MARRNKSFESAFFDVVKTMVGITHVRIAELRSAEQDAQDALNDLHIAEARKKQIEAQTAATLARIEQMKEQNEGIIRRYLLTTENAENAVIRQQKQEIEILKLKLQVLEKQRELGITPDTEEEFKPDNYPLP